MRKISLMVICLSLLGCVQEKSEPLLFTLEKQNFEIKIPAKGELFAAKATVITAPTSQVMMQNIAWMAQEYTEVKKGDVIIRLDGESMMLDKEKKQSELATTQQDLEKTLSTLDKQRHEIVKDLAANGYEKAFSEQFSIDDINIRSKLEILDQMQNTQYLTSKQAYLDWKHDRFDETSTGELGLLELKAEQHQERINKLESSLKQLAIVAPHDGLLTFHANWRGEKPKPGQIIWSGQKLAKLPDISDMKLKLHVLESEAISLKPDQLITFTLNSYAKETFSAKIETVAAYSSTIERGNPQKYIEVIATLDQQNTALFLPGLKLTATIMAHQSSDKLMAPKQSVFNENNESFVYLFDDNQFVKQTVTLGDANLSHVVIDQGLQVGQQVSLIEQGML